MQNNPDQFSSKIGFVLAAAGSAVGIGNLVGFPVAAAKNGGGAFLLLYIFFRHCHLPAADSRRA